jgi:4'-phosphopantetheinyl transferase EntD
MLRQPITDEQLRLAFRQVQRPGWPSTLEAALAHHVYRTCLIGMARNLNRRGIDRAPQLTLFTDERLDA